MKINKHRMLLITMAILITLAGILMGRADEKDDGENKKPKSRYEERHVRNWDEPRKREASSLSFTNKTDYKVSVYANVRKRGQSTYDKAQVKLGSALPGGRTVEFPGLHDNFIGRANTRYWLDLEKHKEGAPAVYPEHYLDRLKFEGTENSSEVLEFKRIGQTKKEDVKLRLKVKQNRGSMEMELAAVDKDLV